MIRTALALLDEVGLDGLTVRRLAERLNVQNPALYWHFKNKQDLLNGMAAALLASAFAGLEWPAAPEDWEEWLANVARRLRQALVAHRDSAHVITAADLSSSQQMVVFDLALRVLNDAGFPLRQAFVGVITLFDYTVGSAIEEQAEPSAHAGAPPEQLSETLPMLQAALRDIANVDASDRTFGFEAGLRLILAGLRSTRSM